MPSLQIFLSIVLVSKGVDLGLSLLNPLTQPAELQKGIYSRL